MCIGATRVIVGVMIFPESGITACITASAIQQSFSHVNNIWVFLSNYTNMVQKCITWSLKEINLWGMLSLQHLITDGANCALFTS